MNHRETSDSIYPYEISFPVDIETVISPQEALKAIHQAIEQIKGYRDSRLYVFEKFIGPLVPEDIRQYFEKFHLNRVSIAYPSLINSFGNTLNFFTLFNLNEDIESIRENQRFIILPYMELRLKKKIERLEKERPFGWRLNRFIYQKNLDRLVPLVDNLMHLISLAWTFCPGIGEPEKATGFFNRFVFTCNGGFIDLGHFYNCAIIAYLYGTTEATRRGEATEVKQRWLRERPWLVKMQERNILRLITNLLWGYATSADTIEDRASDQLGILLGQAMRDYRRNGELIEYFIELYPQLVKEAFLDYKKKSIFTKIWDIITSLLGNLYYLLQSTGVYGILHHMLRFFEEYDAIDPNDSDVVPKGLFKSIVDFYTAKYESQEWDKFTNKEWQVVIPQDLWERVVRGREKFGRKTLPIKIQLKATGQLVDPYEGEAPTI